MRRRSGEPDTDVMNILVAAMVRSVVIGALLAAYIVAIPVIFPDEGGGANIGAGLLAFAGLALIAAGWALLDGLSREFTRVVGSWCVVAALVAVGGLATRAIIEADGSLSILELISLDASLLPIGFSNLFLPALVGAAIGRALSRSPTTPPSSPPQPRPGI